MAESFGSGFAARYRDIFRFIHRRTRSSAEAEELTQQVFADAVEALDGRDPSDDLGLLYTIARRRLIDQIRRSPPATATLAEVGDVESPGSYDAGLRRLLTEAIEQLEPSYRDALVLRLIRGLSFAETAAALGLTEGPPTSAVACSRRSTSSPSSPDSCSPAATCSTFLSARRQPRSGYGRVR
jgi:RNA polymerase sigma factor (sigma-70 family)